MNQRRRKEGQRWEEGMDTFSWAATLCFKWCVSFYNRHNQWRTNRGVSVCEPRQVQRLSYSLTWMDQLQPAVHWSMEIQIRLFLISCEVFLSELPWLVEPICQTLHCCYLGDNFKACIPSFAPFRGMPFSRWPTAGSCTISELIRPSNLFFK